MLAKVAVLTALKNGAFWVFSLLNQPWQSYSCCTGVRNYLVWKRKTHKNLTGLSETSHWHITLVPFAFTGLSHEGVPFYCNQMRCSLFRTVLETDFAWGRGSPSVENAELICHWQCNIKDCERQNKLTFRI